MYEVDNTATSIINLKEEKFPKLEFIKSLQYISLTNIKSSIYLQRHSVGQDTLNRNTDPDIPSIRRRYFSEDSLK